MKNHWLTEDKYYLDKWHYFLLIVTTIMAIWALTNVQRNLDMIHQMEKEVLDTKYEEIQFFRNLYKGGIVIFDEDAYQCFRINHEFNWGNK